MDDGKPTEPKAKWWSRPAPGRGTSAAPQEPSPVEDAVPASDATEASGATEADAEPTASVTAEPVVAEPAPQAAKPLHEPDQYSTPPYGGPGPWAPAPPCSGRSRHRRTAPPYRRPTRGRTARASRRHPPRPPPQRPTSHSRSPTSSHRANNSPTSSRTANSLRSPTNSPSLTTPVAAMAPVRPWGAPRQPLITNPALRSPPTAASGRTGAGPSSSARCSWPWWRAASAAASART